MKFLQLVRYKNLLMIVLTILLTKYSLINETSFSLNFWLFLSSILFFSAFGYVINDIYDIKTDAINKPNKCIVENQISKKNAWILAISLLVLGTMAGLYVAISTNKLILTGFLFVPVFLLFLYSFYFKKIAVIGNLIISFCTSWLFVLVFTFEKTSFVYDSFWQAIIGIFNEIYLAILLIYYSVFAFTTTFIREIIKDIEDINGDYNTGMKTLPILLGIKRSRNIAIFCSLILFAILLFILKDLYVEDEFLLSIYTLLLIVLPLGNFIYQLWNFETKREFSYASNYLKFIMLFGILSMIFFKF